MKEYRALAYIIGEESGAHLEKSIHDEIFMKEGEHYCIMLKNLHPFQKMRATIKLAGKQVGVFQVDPKTSSIIDRPVDVKNKFKCVSENTLSAEQRTLVDVANFDKVQIECHFEMIYAETQCGLAVQTDSASRAGTVLSKEKSNTESNLLMY